VSRAVAILRASSDLGTALAHVTSAAGFVVTVDAIDKALTKRGHPAARSLVGTGGPPYASGPPSRPPVVVVDDEIPVTLDEPEDDTPPTLPGSSQPRVAIAPPAGWRVEEPDERILFVPDCHHPYVDRRAWGVMLQCARRFRPDRIVVLGDFLDCYAVSDHDKDPRRASQLDHEIQVGNEALDELDALGATHKHYVDGNHEARMARYLVRHAPALLDSIRLSDLLRLSERGWTHTPYLEYLRIGDLSVTHACENAGMNAHRQAAGLFMGSVVIGHTHRLAVDQFGSHGRSYTASMFGWLGETPKATYLSAARKARYWSHGFGVGWRVGDTVHTAPVPIVDYTAVIGGEVVMLAA